LPEELRWVVRLVAMFPPCDCNNPEPTTRPHRKSRARFPTSAAQIVGAGIGPSVTGRHGCCGRWPMRWHPIPGVQR